jgi:hypothetical protein
VSESAEDPEGQAEALAARVYQTYLLRRAALVLLAMAGVLAYLAGDYAFGILALWQVSALPAAFLAGFMAADLLFSVVTVRRARRARQPAPEFPGDKMMTAIDAARRRQAGDMPGQPWQGGLRSARFWAWLATRAVYTACAVVVLTAWLGLPAGPVLGAAWCALSVALRAGVMRTLARSDEAVAFIDPRPARDTPEM